jgi:hypothetical protein
MEEGKKGKISLRIGSLFKSKKPIPESDSSFTPALKDSNTTITSFREPGSAAAKKG